MSAAGGNRGSEMKSHVELDKNGNMLVQAIDEFTNTYFVFILKILFFVVSITIGLKYVEILMISRLVKYSAFIFGFVASIVSWCFAILIPWFVIGVDYDFAKEVFKLHSYNDFRIPITFLYLLLPVSRYFTRTLNRTITSYRFRKYLFIVISIITISSIASIIEYLESIYHSRAYLFSFIVMSIIYFILI